jgi:hypothetical protein
MKKIFGYSAVLTGALATQANACDLCSIYSAAQAHGEVGEGFFAGVAEQYTHYGTIQEEGSELPNVASQRLRSSITQALLGYNFNDRVGVQFSIPVIYRSFRRATGHGGIDRDTLFGVGDAALLGNVNLLMKEEKHFTLRAALVGGVKFPTGDTERLEEEEHEHSHGPGALESAIHGHDITLGSGSFDGIVGGTIYGRLKYGFVNASVQYAIRTEGDFDYRFGNDLTWSGGPGMFVFLEDEYSLALQANISGEYKEEDEHHGEEEEGGTGLTQVFLGPKAIFTWSDKLSLEVTGGVPVVSENSGVQLMPDYRIQAGIIWRF